MSGSQPFLSAAFETRERQELANLQTSEEFILLAHPAWPEDAAIFLRFTAVDGPAANACSFRMAWLASAIIAGNAFNGYLSPSRDPSIQPIQAQTGDELLQAGLYWFHVPDPSLTEDTSSITPYHYPIYPNFQAWKYPHGRVPQFWPHNNSSLSEILPCSASEASISVRTSDLFCRVTSHYSGVQAAYICPLAEKEWFFENNMGKYLLRGIQNSANIFALRADIHLVFDSGAFIFFPTADGDFVLRFLDNCSDLVPLYNYQKLSTPRLSGHCLFVRFAWAVFKHLHFEGKIMRRFWVGDKDFAEHITLPSNSDLNSHVQSTAGHSTREPSNKRKGNSPARRQPGRQVKTPKTTRNLANTPAAESLTPPSSISKHHSHGLAECESCEEKEDRHVLEKVFPGMHEVETPTELDQESRSLYYTIQGYPGYRHVERMKQEALEKQRPADYDPDSPTTDS